jgi:UDP-N-acetylglucosamine 3-dehydrogenase
VTLLRPRTSRHKVTLIGLGAMGARHARVLAAMHERFDVVGGYDTRPDVPIPAGVARLSGAKEAIDRAELVVIATPIETHEGLVARALAAGRHVLVEKPLCATAAEAHALSESARSGARLLFVGHSERFNPVVRALARLARRDRVLAIDFVRVGPSRPSDWDVLVNLGVHDLDLAAYLGRGTVTVHGAQGAGPPGSEGRDLAHVLFSTAGGAIGHVYVDRTVATRQRTIRLLTSRWIYEGDLLAQRLARTPTAGGVRTEVPLLIEEPLAAQARAAADALEGGRGREIATGVDGARAVALVERSRSAAASALRDVWQPGIEESLGETPR